MTPPPDADRNNVHRLFDERRAGAMTREAPPN
jgi:hypothetical protein